MGAEGVHHLYTWRATLVHRIRIPARLGTNLGIEPGVPSPTLTVREFFFVVAPGVPGMRIAGIVMRVDAPGWRPSLENLNMTLDG
jgi:hypothetical protein